jgi:HPt (histidine-containing phosphotransfer) domain-containing protein
LQQAENVVDQATIDELFSVADGDASFLADLLLTYREQALTILAAMNDAISRGDRVAAGRSAHALRGASLNIGAASVANLCRQIENAMSDPAVMVASVNAADIDRELHRFERNFQGAL